MEKSVWLANKQLDHAFGKATWTAPSKVYVALLTEKADRDDTGSTLSEATYTGYERVEWDVSDIGSASDGSSANTGVITFPQRMAGGDTIVAIAICDAATGGNVLYFDSDMTSFVVSEQYPAPAIAVGALTITEAAAA